MASIGRIHRRCTGIVQHVKNSSALTGTIANESGFPPAICAPASTVRPSLSNPNQTTKKIIQSFSSSARASANVNEMNAHFENAGGNKKFEYNPERTQQMIIQAAKWNQGKKKWDPQFCQEAVSAYTQHLQYLLDLKQKNSSKTDNNDDHYGIPKEALTTILSSQTTEKALKAMTKMNLDTHLLSKQVRHVERLIGTINLTPLTDNLSLHLLEANGKAGNVGRTISLLHLRGKKNYRPTRKEYQFAIRAIHAAGLYMRKNRNVFLQEDQQPEIDNPTRWLDAILVNMSERGVQLDTFTANQMLDCYCSTGRSGKAIHFFYRVTRQYIDEHGKDAKDDDNDTSDVISGSEHRIPDKIVEKMPVFEDRKTKVRMRMRQHMPPYYKIPSDVKLNGELVKRPSKEELIPKLEWEKEKDFSLSLTSAFAFADSLTHGACGHDPIKLDLTSWNTLVKACCYRGAIWRAMEILNDTLPRQGIEPDAFTYNTIIAGLARLGDKDFSRELLTTMTNTNIPVDKFTIQALVDGYLNAGDISGAVTLVQDMFNQHHILPPYTTHLKVIEFAIGNDLVYEAKRQVFFIQQLWKYTPKEGDSEEFQKIMLMTQKNPKLSKNALKRLFAYFGEDLNDNDFF